MCEENLTGILDTMSDGVIRIDAGGLVTYVNRAAVEIVGFERDEFLGLNYRMPGDLELYSEDGYSITPDRLGAATALRTREPVRNLVIGARHPGQPMVWLKVDADPLFDEAGNLVGAQAVFSDITARQQRLNTLMKIMEDIRLAIRVERGDVPLSSRQMDVLKLVALGYSNQEIADRLDKSESTIRTTVSGINKILGTRTRQLPIYTFRRGLVNIQEH